MAMFDNIPGLLDLLRNSAMGQNLNAGIGADVAQYPGMPQQPQRYPTMPALDPKEFNEIDAAAPAAPRAVAGSGNATLPANAAPTSGRMPAAPFSLAGPSAPAPVAQSQDTSPGIGDRLLNGFKGFVGNMHNGIGGALAGGVGALVTGERTDPGGIEAQKLAQTNNATARALLAKGVDPTAIAAAVGNPEIMKQLVTQHFGPQNVTNLANGYVWDARQGKAVKAYEPEDKTPAGFRKTDEGGMEYIPNGPADPKYIAASKVAGETSNATSAIAQREQAIVARGGDPKEPRNQQFILTGKFPREDAQPQTATDKRAILEADEGVLNNTTVVSALKEAKKLSPQAHTGYFAGTRATLGNNLPDALVPDFLASPESSAATANYENLVLGQALGQLKSTFGAAPTEGERKILLELQASADKPDHVRQEILNRAIAIAENHLKFNQQKADDLRGGTYFKSQRGSSNPSNPSAGGPQLQPGQSTGMGDVVIKRIN
jgi:hypothetical protein